MRIQPIQQNTYKKNSNPNFKMILVPELSKGCFDPQELEDLGKFVSRIEPFDQKVGLRVLVLRNPDSSKTDVEIVSGNFSTVATVKFNYNMQDLANMLRQEHIKWRGNIDNVLSSLGFDKVYLLNSK